MGLIPGLGWSPGRWHGNPLQYSCLENPMGRRTWWAKVHTVTKSQEYLGFPGGSDGKESAWMQETGIWSLDWEDPMWNEMATHSSTLPWRIPWTEEPGSLLSMGSPKFDNGWAIALISHANKVMLKILQARLQQYVNHELPDVLAGLRKRQRDQRSNCQHLLDHGKSKRVPEKHLFLLYRICQSLWLCESQQTVENFERDGNTRPPDLPLDKPVCSSGSNT